MEENTVIAKTVEKINDFYKSNAALIFFISVTTIFGFVQIILYSLNVIRLNGYYIDEVENWLSIANWVLIGVSISSCYVGFIGAIYMVRGSLNFVWWLSITNILSVITQALSQMWFGASLSMFLFFFLWFRYFVWKHDWLEKWDLSDGLVLSCGLALLVVLLTTFNLIAFYYGDVIYASSNWMKPINYQFDASIAAMCIVASTFLMFKLKWGFLIFLASKVFAISNYAGVGLIVPIVQMSLFAVVDVTGFIGWSIKPVTQK